MADSAPPLLTVRELKSPDLHAGAPFASVLVVKKLQIKTAANGNAFLSLELGDRGGSFSCTVFGDSPFFDLIKNAGDGAVVRIEAGDPR
jgi:3'-5' exoribonuclease